VAGFPPVSQPLDPLGIQIQEWQDVGSSRIEQVIKCGKKSQNTKKTNAETTTKLQK